MRGRGRALLLVAVIALPAAAACVVAVGASAPRARTENGEAFQELVGGLGLGPAVDFSRCVREFDPRMNGACAWRHEPVLGGSIFCPAHAGAGR